MTVITIFMMMGVEEGEEPFLVFLEAHLLVFLEARLQTLAEVEELVVEEELPFQGVLEDHLQP
jgi:hypothetical protein